MSTRDEIEDRLRLLADAWGMPAGDIFERLSGRIDSDTSPRTLWQIACVVRMEIPLRARMVRLLSDQVIEGTNAALERLIREEMARDRTRGQQNRPQGVVFVDGGTLLDVHDTCQRTKTTGIQRVVREVTRRWDRDHEVTLVAWSVKGGGLRNLFDWERNSVLGLEVPSGRTTVKDAPMVVPLGGTFTISELAAEDFRAARLESLAEFSGMTVNVIGYDCVPMTASETSSDGIAASFPIYLDAIARSSRVAAISSAAATEFKGWRRMLRASGLDGPDIANVGLAAEMPEPTEDELGRVSEELGLGASTPLVLVVGSHEPRKNHLAVLQAAELLWRNGSRFELVFVGGASWHSDRFHRQVTEMQASGRSVRTVSKADDAYLAAAYRLAAFTVFPSLHEGFGLPVAESLALGTPVITSHFGSMRELVEHGGGGLLVDPHSDDEVMEAMRSLLEDDSLRVRLADEARARAPRRWDAYASDLWEFFAADEVA